MKDNTKKIILTAATAAILSSSNLYEELKNAFNAYLIVASPYSPQRY